MSLFLLPANTFENTKKENCFFWIECMLHWRSKLPSNNRNQRKITCAETNFPIVPRRKLHIFSRSSGLEHEQELMWRKIWVCAQGICDRSRKCCWKILKKKFTSHVPLKSDVLFVRLLKCFRNKWEYSPPLNQLTPRSDFSFKCLFILWYHTDFCLLNFNCYKLA